MVLSVAFSPDGKTLAAGGGRWTEHGELTLWDVATGKPLDLHGHDQWVECVAFSSDGAALVSAGGTPNSLGELRLWDLKGTTHLPATIALPMIPGRDARPTEVGAAPRSGGALLFAGAMGR
jgi:WD40 repeat protein